MHALGSYLRTVQEPSTSPVYADSPQDIIREIAAKHGIPLAAFVAAMDNAIADGVLDHLPGQHTAADSLPRIVALIGDGPNCGLRAWCIDFVAGTNIFNIQTETEIGQRWGVERATVNRLIQEIRNGLHLVVVPGCRPESTRITYAIRARKNHAEKKITKKPQQWHNRALTTWRLTLAS